MLKFKFKREALLTIFSPTWWISKQSNEGRRNEAAKERKNEEMKEPGSNGTKER